MAISTYTNLQTALTNWTARADLSSEWPDVIMLAENDFNNRLRTLQMETRAALTINGEFVAVPNDFLEVRSLRLDQSPAVAMEYLSPDMGIKAYGSTGTPQFFSISGGNFRFAPVPDGTYAATLHYYAKIPALALNATNWLLTQQPQLYLLGSLYWASGRLQNDERVPGIKSLYEDALRTFKGGDARNRWGGPGMAMRAA